MPVTFEIHPSIGISRVGTSEDFFIGPEPGEPPPAKYRDERGKLLRQAARFRVFECERDDSGGLVRADDVTGSAKVEWTVHVANRKAEGPKSPPPLTPRRRTERRNNDHADRDALVIDPGPRTVRSPGVSAAFDTGRFLGRTVALGGVQVDRDGRLVVLPGSGRSEGPPGDLHFANNDGWFDDVSDGPVTASVRVGRRRAVEAVPAWVIAAPPDFAPQITNFVTMYDVGFQVAVERGWRGVPEKPSFTRDILPILSRAVGYAWVMQAARGAHGPGGPQHFLDPARLARLADPTRPKAARRAIVDELRDPADPEPAEGTMPRLHDETNTRLGMPPTAAQYQVLQAWAEGAFVNDLGQPAPPEPAPDALDRAALEACAGGPFFPGIEAGRIITEAHRYASPFRLDAGTLRAGQITEGNAVPWQADFLLCRFDDLNGVGWWPAQRPDNVLTDAVSGRFQRWARRVESFADMIANWHQLGVVVPATAPDGRKVFIESERTL